MPLSHDLAAIDVALRQFDSELIAISEKHKLRLSQLHCQLSLAGSEFQLEMDDLRRRYKSWRIALNSSNQSVIDE